MDYTLYWFMFPVAIMVATLAMMSGIAGAALFMPIFLLLFPLLGDEYPLNSPNEAVASALLTSSFGFISGFAGYYRNRLIDFQQAKAFLFIAMLFAVIGSIISAQIPEVYLRMAYGFLTLLLAIFILSPSLVNILKYQPSSIKKTLTDKNGNTYSYLHYRIIRWMTALGGFFTGLLSVGIGETTITQLSKIGNIPIPVASATSVVVVICTLSIGALTQCTLLISQGGINAVPWHLVCYTIPGVIIGGQLGPSLHGILSSERMQKSIAMLFIFIGFAMLVIVMKELNY